jgi:hypothetical protein
VQICLFSPRHIPTSSLHPSHSYISHCESCRLEALHPPVAIQTSNMASTARQLGTDDAAFLLDVLHHLDIPIAVSWSYVENLLLRQSDQRYRSTSARSPRPGMQHPMPFTNVSSRSDTDTVSTSKAAAGEYAKVQRATVHETWSPRHLPSPICRSLTRSCTEQ